MANPSNQHIGRKSARFGFATIYDMTGEFDGYYGVVVGCCLQVVTPSWNDAKRSAIAADEAHGRN